MVQCPFGAKTLQTEKYTGLVVAYAKKCVKHNLQTERHTGLQSLFFWKTCLQCRQKASNVGASNVRTLKLFLYLSPSHKPAKIDLGIQYPEESNFHGIQCPRNPMS